MPEEVKKVDVLKYLELLAPLFPTPVYWYDLNSNFVGANEHSLLAVGVTSFDDLVGKSLYELYPPDIARHIAEHNEKVIRTGQVLSQEEPIKDITTGKVRYYDAFKAPLYDDDGKIVGAFGTSIETTDKKEKERLVLENKNQKIEHQKKLINLAHTVAHDISSPLSALSMMMHSCEELHEKKRAVINRAIASILDIANNLLSTYRNEEQGAMAGVEQREFVLISDAIVHLLSEKKVQYGNRTIQFEIDIANDAQFAFACLQPSQFRRAMSNLINNAVDALGHKSSGLVTIQLTVDAQSIFISIRDNGKGMSADAVEKMRNRRCFTEGKQGGHGIGLQQVWSTLDGNEGTMQVNSLPGGGTTICLTFPRVVAASWIAQAIRLELNSTIVILDDDDSIHGAWDTRFARYVKLYPNLRVHHFKHGEDALAFLRRLGAQEKDRVVFLSDYELLQQDKNGLQIIEESQIQNTTLVTSYYSNADIRDQAIALGVKILPKQMASVIPILLTDRI